MGPDRRVGSRTGRDARPLKLRTKLAAETHALAPPHAAAVPPTPTALALVDTTAPPASLDTGPC